MFDRWYGAPPPPPYILAFNRNDSIMAIYDAEAEGLGEGSETPLFACVLDPSNDRNVGHVLRSISHFMALNHEISVMICELRHVAEKAHIAKMATAIENLVTDNTE